jgi:predicted component of type VI protein secretion system
MPAQLLSLTDGPSLLLDKPVLLIGRNEECDIQLNSRKVSRKHCCIAQVNDYLVVRDLGSTNGIRINGVRLKEGTLRTGDELTIGNFRYQVHAERPREVAPPPVPPLPPKPAAAPPRPPAFTEDDLLEAAEEPVPLPDVPGARVPAGRKPPTPPPQSPPPLPRPELSYRIPEDVRLKSESSLHPPPAAGSPPV